MRAYERAVKNIATSDAFAVATDVSAGEAVFVVMGPESRDLLRQVTPDDLSNEAFPFGTAREIELAEKLGFRVSPGLKQELAARKGAK